MPMPWAAPWPSSVASSVADPSPARCRQARGEAPGPAVQLGRAGGGVGAADGAGGERRVDAGEHDDAAEGQAPLLDAGRDGGEPAWAGAPGSWRGGSGQGTRMSARRRTSSVASSRPASRAARLTPRRSDSACTGSGPSMVTASAVTTGCGSSVSESLALDPHLAAELIRTQPLDLRPVSGFQSRRGGTSQAASTQARSRPASAARRTRISGELRCRGLPVAAAAGRLDGEAVAGPELGDRGAAEAPRACRRRGPPTGGHRRRRRRRRGRTAPRCGGEATITAVIGSRNRMRRRAPSPPRVWPAPPDMPRMANSCSRTG